MLTSTAYVTGLLVYVFSALLALVLANFWFLRRAPAAVKALISFPLAALLLTPAYISAGADTLAPALIVVAFQWLSQGQEAAAHAIRPLLLFTGVGVGLGLISGVFLWRRDRAATQADPALDLAAED